MPVNEPRRGKRLAGTMFRIVRDPVIARMANTPAWSS